MKRNILVALACICFVTTPAISMAAPYVSASVGASIAGEAKFDGRPHDLKECAVFNGAVGYDLSLIRLELGIDYQSHPYVGRPEWGDLSFLTVSLNGYLDFDTGKGFAPYIMAGTGVTDVNTGDDYVNSTAFSLQAGAGVGIPLAKSITADLGYRFLRPVNLKSIKAESVDWNSHNILAGLRFGF
ncbi:outer membrane protein [Chlorobium phaeovibrioides]|uniref:Outer membrane beta-barrel protein n=1 Tax=Chlorobium phaeovibrioides TaxID=1094 RepID=A0A5M8IE19_CHLPH|nr:outer membrane beta-barrel protein [Chlorobium phaeovibrioides]KAA6232589.1 porin family protein [Chlorobium phaeovibrioides]MWV55144.1 outer membrane beta-barrel protein [Chlorobium phaeovibrioides]